MRLPVPREIGDAKAVGEQKIWPIAAYLSRVQPKQKHSRSREDPNGRLHVGIAEPGDGFDDGRGLAETGTQRHRRANLPRRTSAFSSRHDDNV